MSSSPCRRRLILRQPSNRHEARITGCRQFSSRPTGGPRKAYASHEGTAARAWQAFALTSLTHRPKLPQISPPHIPPRRQLSIAPALLHPHQLRRLQLAQMVRSRSRGNRQSRQRLPARQLRLRKHRPQHLPPVRIRHRPRNPLKLLRRKLYLRHHISAYQPPRCYPVPQKT